MPATGDPVQEIDEAIRHQQSTRAEAQVALEVATYKRDAAMADADAANADIAKARAVIKARDVDIDKLLEQRQAHIPYPRRPPD